MRISDWSSDVCSSDLVVQPDVDRAVGPDLRVDLHQPGQLLKQPVAVVLKPRVLRGAVGRAAQAGIEAGKRTADLVDPRDRLVDVLPDAGARARERLGKRAELLGDLERKRFGTVTSVQGSGDLVGRRIINTQ